MAISAQLVKELREITSAGMMDCKKALEATNGDIDKAIIWLRENGLAKAAKKADRVAAEGVSLAKTDSKKAVIIEVNSETDFVSKNEKFVTLINDFADALLSSDAKTLDDALKIKIKSGETIEEACVSATATIGEKISFRRFELLSIGDLVTTIYNHSNSRVSTLLQFSGSISKEDAYNIAMHVAAMNPRYISMDDIPQDFKDEEEHIIKELMAKDEKFAGKPEAMIKGIVNGKLSKRLSEVALVEQDYVIDENFKVGKFIESKNSKIVKMIRYEVGEGIEKQVVDFASEVAAQLKGSN